MTENACLLIWAYNYHEVNNYTYYIIISVIDKYILSTILRRIEKKTIGCVYFE
jgi:hypothetical protein